jgi:hypothetical protein
MEFGIKDCCEALSVSRSGYYQWQQGEEGPRAQANRFLGEQIGQVFEAHKGRYGSPRVTRALRQAGVRCGENRVARLMRERGLAARPKRAFRPRTTRAGAVAAPNLIKDLAPNRPDQIWVSDITYVATRQGWLFLMVILDFFSRLVVGWKLGENATAEAFFSTLKTEAFPPDQVFATKVEARRELFAYLEGYYNNQRLHSSLGYQTPRQFETNFKEVIDSQNGVPEVLTAAPEDRALRGRTSSAGAALRTAGLAAERRPAGLCRCKPKAKNPREFEGQSPSSPTLKTPKKT